MAAVRGQGVWASVVTVQVCAFRLETREEPHACLSENTRPVGVAVFLDR